MKRPAEFRREASRNYMVLTPDQNYICRYTVRMLSNNRILGLLPFHEKILDGKISFYYDITSKQPLERVLETHTITGPEIYQLVTELLSALRQLEKFLIDENQLCLRPEAIYIDPDTFQCGWCLIPEREGNFCESFREFAQYLLDHVNHNDKDAVVLAFGIFKQSRKENFGVENLAAELAKGIYMQPEKDNRCRSPQKAERSANLWEAEEIEEIVNTAGSEGRERKLEDREKSEEELQANGFNVGTDKRKRKSEKSGKAFDQHKMIIEMGCFAFAALFLPAAGVVLWGIPGVIRYKWLFAGSELVLAVLAVLYMRENFRNGDEKPQNRDERYQIRERRLQGREEKNQIRERRLQNRGNETQNREKGSRNEKRASWETGGESDGSEYGKPAFSPEMADLEILFREDEEENDEMWRETCQKEEDEVFHTMLLTASSVERPVHKLIPVHGGAEIPVRYFPFFIGKNKGICDFCLEEPGVSRMHLKIEDTDAGIRVTDLNSTNGTYVNGCRLESNEASILKDGDEIEIASRKYKFL